MDENQLIALFDQENSYYLTKTLEPVVSDFLDSLQFRAKVISSAERTVVETGLSPAAQLCRLFGILKNKDSGWPALIVYLKENDYNSHAIRLQKSAGEMPSSSVIKAPGSSSPSLNSSYQSICGLTFETDSVLKPGMPAWSSDPNLTPITQLEEFIMDVAEFYLGNYIRLISLGDYHKHVKEAWVPLPMEEKTEGSHQHHRFYPNQLIHRLATDIGANVALINADPGMGKTALVIKIAYDWAVKQIGVNKFVKNRRKPGKQLISRLFPKLKQTHSSTNLDLISAVDNFRLILALPLREAGRADNFLHLAVDYFIKILKHKRFDRDSLMNQIERLQSKLLLCLDGLDEYANYGNSPFRSLFTPALCQQPKLVPTPSSPPFIRYKLIITSRPYACEHLNRGFLPLRYEIRRCDEENLLDFVRIYCQSEAGVLRVTKFLHSDTLVIKVPLILTFVCHLADANEEIPTTLTLLYDSFLREMWLREKRRNRLVDNDDDIHQWKQSKVVISTAALAYWGCQERKFEFNPRKLEEFDIINDSFVCGFLLYKFDFAQACQMAKFPHRSVHEFFAALHGHHLINANETAAAKWIMREICNEDSQFGRFFLGISSQNQNFSKMLDTLCPSSHSFSLYNMIDFHSDLRCILLRFSDCLCDCCETDVRNCGQWLANLISRIDHDFANPNRIEVLNVKMLQTGEFKLNQIFQEGLKLEFIEKRSSDYDWFMCVQTKTAKVAWITGEPATEMAEKFDIIDVVLWLWNNGDILAGLYLLPPVTTMFVRMTDSSEREVNFHLEYDSFIPAQLQFFSFGCEKCHLEQLEWHFCSQEIPQSLKVIDKRETGQITWLTVKVSLSAFVSQGFLIEKLIQLAVLQCQPRNAIANTCDYELPAPGDKLDEYRQNEELDKVGYINQDCLNRRENLEPGFSVLANVTNPGRLLTRTIPQQRLLHRAHKTDSNHSSGSYADIGGRFPQESMGSAKNIAVMMQPKSSFYRAYDDLPQLPKPRLRKKLQCHIF